VTIQITVDVVDIEAPVLLVPTTAVTAISNATGTATVEYDVSATDNVLGNVPVSCDAPSGSDFPIGTTTVTCEASDEGPNATGGVNTATETFTVTVTDGTPPVVTAPDVELRRTYFDPENPDFARIQTSEYGVTASDIGGSISSLSCVRDDEPELPLTIEDFEFSDEPYNITCTAEDSAGNEGSASFRLTVSYEYDIEVTVGKTRVKLGSTIPFDWLYRDSAGNLVDSSHLQPDIGITWATTSDCIKPDNTGPSGEDSGSSAFRYSAADGIWQYSLQTKDLMGDGQQYLVSIVPPGVGVESATTCVTLR
jgi:hypothetical protein